MDLSNQISSKFGKKGGYENQYDEEQLIDIHHIFLKTYGWIPIEEYRKIPLPMMNNLLKRINKDQQRENEKEKAMFGKR